MASSNEESEVFPANTKKIFKQEPTRARQEPTRADKSPTKDIRFITGTCNAKADKDRTNSDRTIAKFGFGNRNKRGGNELSLQT